MAVFGILLMMPAHADGGAARTALLDVTFLQFFVGSIVVFSLTTLTVGKEKTPSLEA